MCSFKITNTDSSWKPSSTISTTSCKCKRNQSHPCIPFRVFRWYTRSNGSNWTQGGSEDVKFGLNTLRTDLKLIFNQPLTSDMQLIIETPQTQRNFHVHKIILYSRSVLIRDILEEFPNNNNNTNTTELSFNHTNFVRSAKFIGGSTDTLFIQLADHQVIQQCQKLIEYLYSDAIDMDSKNEAEIIKLLAEDFQVSSRIFTMCDHVIIGSLREAPVSTLGKEISRFVNYPLFEDIRIEVEGEIFCAHKAIVCRCEYYKALLTAGFGESKQDCIHMMDVSKDAFLEVLRYLYADTAQLTPDNVVEVHEVYVDFLTVVDFDFFCSIRGSGKTKENVRAVPFQSN